MFIAQASAMATWAQTRMQNTTQRELIPIVPSVYAAVPITSVMVTPQVTDALMAGERVAGAVVLERGEAQDYPPAFQLTKSVTLTLPARTSTEHAGRRPTSQTLSDLSLG